jgi:hypothetical protein
MKIRKKLRSIIKSRIKRQIKRNVQNRIRQQKRRNNRNRKSNNENNNKKKLPLPTLINLNSRSICNKKQHLNQLLQDTNIDIAIITETWITEDNEQIHLNDIKRSNPNYELFSARRTRSDVAIGGGIIIMINKQFSPESIELKSTTNRTDQDNNQDILETLIVKVNPTRKPREFTSCIIVATYIPPGKKHSNKKLDMTIATNQLNKLITDVTNQKGIGANPLIYIAGDFNGANTSLLNKTHTTKQINKKATRKDKILDPIFTNAPNCYDCINLPPLGNSDHDIIKATPIYKKYKKSRPLPVTKKVRSGKIQHTIQKISELDWKPLIYSNLDTQTKFDIFYSSIHETIEQTQPYKTIKIKGDKPWMTTEIKQEIIKRQRLFYLNKFDEWKTQCNTINKLIKKRKKAHFKKLTTNTPKETWKAINELKNEPKTEIKSSIEECEKINNFFTSSWGNNKQPNIQQHTTRDSTKPIRIKQLEILQELENLDSKKATGPDNISPLILKSARYELVEIITHLINSSLQSNVVPTQWKQADIVPIPKINKPTEPSDFRPVALTSVLCKILERILTKYIIEHTQNLWRNSDQFGFLPNKSTSDAVIKVIEDWSEATDKQEEIHAVFFDFSKAFDLVDHDILLNKINKHIPRWLTTWIAQYLINRTQRVKIQEFKSEWKNVEAGVIQGSVLGPTLFILFLNDINEYIPKDTKAPKYADDILTYSKTKESTQAAAEGIHNWTVENKMKLNIKKTQYMVLNEKGNNNNKPDAIIIQNEQITKTNSYKYLGTTLNNQLNWQEHWNHISRKFNSTLYLLKSMNQLGFNKKVMVNVYKSFIVGQIISNAYTLCSVTKEIIEEIKHIQNRVIKIININKNDYDKYKIIDIEELISNRCEKMIIKIINDETHPVTKELIPKATNYSTRRYFPFEIKTPRTTLYQNSFVQKYLTVAEQKQLIKPKTKLDQTNTNDSPSISKTTKDNSKLKAKCNFCQKEFSGLQIHLKKNPICRVKHQESTKQQD